MASSVLQIPPKDVSLNTYYPPPPPPPPASVIKISPAVLFTIIIIAFLFFISGVLHLLVRFLTKHPNPSTPSDIPASETLQRQLQQLFNLHDSGLDQSLIDALPVFSYSEIVGPKDKEPFDCAVCLSEFSDNDKLRLLPSCTHAFHLNCIDTWLLSNSTCPLCRSTLFLPDDEDPVFSVRLGKFRRWDNIAVVEMEEASNSCLDARRCYSMGSYQYVVGNTHLRVALCPPHPRPEINNVGNGDGLEGKKITSASRGDSYSVSKIWLWQNKGGSQSSSRDARIDLQSLGSEFPWIQNA